MRVQLYCGDFRMRTLSFVFVLIFSLFLASGAYAQVFLDPWFSPPEEHADLGDITSDGTGGRQIQIRPLEAEDIGRMWKFFPPHFQLPEVFPDPTPATPAQQDILLTTGTSLVLVLPQLQHFPSGASVSVSHSISGHEIRVDASIHYLGYDTATIYGPHEYLHPLGMLTAGEYRLTLNLSQSSELSLVYPSTTTGYVDFVVQPIPEPTTFVLFGVCSTILVHGFSRRLRKVPTA